MPYPTLERYNEAFQLHSKLLADPELRRGSIAKTGLGLPLAISGGFALTYTITSVGAKFAVRCFHRDAAGLERRYAAISNRLAKLASPYFLNFEFQPCGISVDGAAYPIVKMAWAQGETLGEFLEDKRRDASALGKLIDALDALGAFFERERLSHGDIQTGNLMISGGGSRIQLIDYDGMYVDEIKDLRSEEAGHLNFQHPLRKALNPFGPGLDRFSLISLRVALRALRADPSIWDKTKSELDAIVFRANDFADPGASLAFARVAAAPGMAAEAAAFAAICRSPMDRTPSLADFAAARNTPSMSITLAGAPAAGAARAGYLGPYATLSATDYAACLRHVSSKVEVIGRIVDVKPGVGKRGPYVFINFGNWREKIFKLSIWADGLDAFGKKPPDRSWIGKWVSATGLMEPPYTNNRYGYWHLSISIAAPGEMSVIDEAEARWRLAGPGTGAAPPAAAASNRAALDKILGKSIAGSPAAPARPAAAPATPAPPRPPLTPNQRVLDNIRAAAGPPPAAPPAPSPIPRGPSAHRPASPHAARQTPTPPPTRRRSEIEVVAGKILKWLFR